MKNIAALSSFTSLLAFAGSATAHMQMIHPPPLRSQYNPYSGSDIDYNIADPLQASGDNFPCKGSLYLLGTRGGTPVANWTPGQSYNMTIQGGASHEGGSCQASISLDGGKTFKVVHSYMGNCPVDGTSSYDFTLPSDTPASDEAIFAWTWFNRIGNREMYMNCAVVTIGSGDGGARWKKPASAVSFSSLPEIFKANINNNCRTIEGKDVRFPNPGSAVTIIGDKFADPVGDCDPPALASSTSTTLPGGAFIFVSTTGSPTAKPTTLVCVAVPAAAPTSSHTVPPASTPTSGSCGTGDLWNCVGGYKFQRYSSGQWSQIIPMPAGTKCRPGMSDSLVVL